MLSVNFSIVVTSPISQAITKGLGPSASQPKNKTPDYCAVYLGNNKLTWVESVKYLGIHITNNVCDSKDIKIKIGNFFASVNSLIGNFKDLPSCVINDLFSSY